MGGDQNTAIGPMKSFLTAGLNRRNWRIVWMIRLSDEQFAKEKEEFTRENRIIGERGYTFVRFEC